MNKRISLDLETRSLAALDKVGSYKYAEDPSTEVLILAVREGVHSEGRPVLTWDMRNPARNEATELLHQAICDGWEIHAFNYSFEWPHLKYVLPRQLGLPTPRIEQMRCTQAVCRTAGLPGSLDACAQFLKLPIQKDKMGSALIQKFSKPIKGSRDFLSWDAPVEFTAGGVRMTAAEAFQRFVDYCARDVETEMAISEVMKPFELKGFPLDWFLLDARMNDRGIPVDTVALEQAQVVLKAHEKWLSEEFRRITGGLSPKQNKAVLEWLENRGYRGENLRKDTREKFQDDPRLMPEAREALRIASDLSFAAVKKVPAMLTRAMSDGKVRGTFKWCGAQKTWRWSSEGIQLQNMKKPPKWLRKVIEQAYNDLRSGQGGLYLELTYCNPYELIACLARYFIRYDDQNLLDLDFASVEARVLPALIECQRILDRFVSGEGDIYTQTGESLAKVLKEKFKVDFDIDRDMGKVVVLACIAEGEPVLTQRGLVPIENIRIDDLVWDGIEWVRHEGLICRGYKEVISYQGLSATPDHKVFVEECEGPVPFEIAASKLYRIRNTGKGRSPIRILDAHVSQDNTAEFDAKSRSSLQVRNGEAGILGLSSQRDLLLLSEVQRSEEHKTVSEMAPRKADGSASPMPKSRFSLLQALWGKGGRVSVSERGCGGGVGHGKSWLTKRFGAGSQGQQWALRGGKSSLGHSQGADSQHAENSAAGLFVSTGDVAVFRDGSSEEAETRFDQKSDSFGCKASSLREAKKLESHTRKVRVYDLVNAGPRHRFTVSGVLVSNCQFQGGWHAVFTATGSTWKREWCEAAARIVRQENPEFKEAWKKFQDVFVEAMDSPDRWHPVTKYVSMGYTKKGPFPRMLMRLASGRSICWPHPEKHPITMVGIEKSGASTRWTRIPGHYDTEDLPPRSVKLAQGEFVSRTFRTWEVDFHGHVKGKTYGRVKTYGGDMLQSATQGTAADLLAYGALEAERQGFEPILVVHDQCLAPATGDPEDFRKALTTVPPWFEGFPLDAEADVVRSYCKS